MAGFIEGADREQIALFPDRLEEWVGGDNPVRMVDAFVDSDFGRGTVKGKVMVGFLGRESVQSGDP